MLRTKRISTLATIATIALLPASAGATQLHGNHSQGPGAYSCGINYSMNSVNGKYCPSRHATLQASVRILKP
jgi:hypothetical protein